MHVVSVVGARPSFVKLAPVASILKSRGVRHTVIHTGQHYDHNMSGGFIDGLGIPAADVHLGIGSGSHGKQTGEMLAALDPALSSLTPDWVLAYGDTNSTLAGALASVKLQLPLAHLEAGLRSFNRAMPEEHNRVLVDHAADLCLVPTVVGMANLAKEGLAGRSVLVGDVMTDICFGVRDQMKRCPVALPVLSPGAKFVLATIHRAENTDDKRRLTHVLHALASLDVPVVLPAHPRLVAAAQKFGIALAQGSLRIVEPLGYHAMVSAMMQSRAVITDSGGLQKEAFLLQRLCTTVRTETEWPETMENNWNRLDPDCVDLSEILNREIPDGDQGLPYGDGNAARRVVECLMKV